MPLVLNGVLALSEGVPQLDGLIARTGDNLTVVSGESDRQDILGVANELTVAHAGVDVPKTEGSIPRTRQNELSIRGDDNIRDEVGVTSESTTGGSVLDFVLGKVPDDDGLVTRTGHQNIAVLRGGSDGSHPARVTFHDTTEGDLGGGGVHVDGDGVQEVERGKRKRELILWLFWRLFAPSKVGSFVTREGPFIGIPTFHTILYEKIPTLRKISKDVKSSKNVLGRGWFGKRCFGRVSPRRMATKKRGEKGGREKKREKDFY